MNRSRRSRSVAESHVVEALRPRTAHVPNSKMMLPDVPAPKGHGQKGVRGSALRATSPKSRGVRRGMVASAGGVRADASGAGAGRDRDSLFDAIAPADMGPTSPGSPPLQPAAVAGAPGSASSRYEHRMVDGQRAPATVGAAGAGGLSSMDLAPPMTLEEFVSAPYYSLPTHVRGVPHEQTLTAVAAHRQHNERDRERSHDSGTQLQYPRPPPSATRRRMRVSAAHAAAARDAGRGAVSTLARSTRLLGVHAAGGQKSWLGRAAAGLPVQRRAAADGAAQRSIPALPTAGRAAGASRDYPSVPPRSAMADTTRDEDGFERVGRSLELLFARLREEDAVATAAAEKRAATFAEAAETAAAAAEKDGSSDRWRALADYIDRYHVDTDADAIREACYGLLHAQYERDRADCAPHPHPPTTALGFAVLDELLALLCAKYPLFETICAAVKRELWGAVYLDAPTRPPPQETASSSPGQSPHSFPHDLARDASDATCDGSFEAVCSMQTLPQAAADTRDTVGRRPHSLGTEGSTMIRLTDDGAGDDGDAYGAAGVVGMPRTEDPVAALSGRMLHHAHHAEKGKTFYTYVQEALARVEHAEQRLVDARNVTMRQMRVLDRVVSYWKMEFQKVVLKVWRRWFANLGREEEEEAERQRLEDQIERLQNNLGLREAEIAQLQADMAAQAKAWQGAVANKDQVIEGLKAEIYALKRKVYDVMRSNQALANEGLELQQFIQKKTDETNALRSLLDNTIRCYLEGPEKDTAQRESFRSLLEAEGADGITDWFFNASMFGSGFSAPKPIAGIAKCENIFSLSTANSRIYDYIEHYLYIIRYIAPDTVAEKDLRDTIEARDDRRSLDFFFDHCATLGVELPFDVDELAAATHHQLLSFHVHIVTVLFTRFVDSGACGAWVDDDDGSKGALLTVEDLKARSAAAWQERKYWRKVAEKTRTAAMEVILKQKQWYR